MYSLTTLQKTNTLCCVIDAIFSFSCWIMEKLASTMSNIILYICSTYNQLCFDEDPKIFAFWAILGNDCVDGFWLNILLTLV